MQEHLCLPVLDSSSAQLDLCLGSTGSPSEGVCSATSVCKQAGQLLVLKAVIYTMCICLMSSDLGLKREASGESIDLS